MAFEPVDGSPVSVTLLQTPEMVQLYKAGMGGAVLDVINSGDEQTT
jgi:hypothetical protein